MAATAFYENVARHRLEGRELDTDETQQNRVLQFAPGNGQLMLIACLWSRWSGPGQADVLSFAAITDEPLPEIQAAGHDRCIIPVKPGNVATWLATPAPDAVDYEAILDDRERRFYAHLLAA
ncbi:SOS response-associated peptidase family protein [Duganella levis]|uniref:SOS response-associated peptidase family protein n=1 Tax=Duganella levis TaxID=2692169 RepID=UPI003530C230